MITRKTYAGAKGKAHLAKLSASYLLQPKLDGSYAEIRTDERGAVSSLTLRSGRMLEGDLAADYLGLIIGAPCSTFAGEVELYTEAGNRHARIRGYRSLYLTDCLSLDGADVTSLPYAERHAWLERIRAASVGLVADSHYRDRFGRFHDGAGRFARGIPLSHGRYAVAPQAPLQELSQLLRRWVTFEKFGPCEGLVAVDQSAPLGAPRSKLKLKTVDTLDAVVSDVDSKRVSLYYRGKVFTCGLTNPWRGVIAPGQVVEVSHEGFYERSFTPRFARLVRPRPDLSADTLALG